MAIQNYQAERIGTILNPLEVFIRVGLN